MHLGEEPVLTNDVKKPRTVGGISLGPIGKQQGGYRFMSLDTGKILKRHFFKALPIPHEVIQHVLEIRKAEGVAESLEIIDHHGNVLLSEEWNIGENDKEDPTANENEDHKERAATNPESEENRRNSDDDSTLVTKELDSDASTSKNLVSENLGSDSDGDDDDFDNKGAKNTPSVREVKTETPVDTDEEAELINEFAGEISDALDKVLNEIEEVTRDIEAKNKYVNI